MIQDILCLKRPSWYLHKEILIVPQWTHVPEALIKATKFLFQGYLKVRTLRCNRQMLQQLLSCHQNLNKLVRLLLVNNFQFSYRCILFNLSCKFCLLPIKRKWTPLKLLNQCISFIKHQATDKMWENAFLTFNTQIFLLLSNKQRMKSLEKIQ